MDLLEFLTSKEIIIVYIVAGVACLLCFIIYLVDRNNVKARLRHNTRELNKLVEEVKEELDEEEVKEEPIVYEEPVLEIIEPVEEAASVPIVAPERVEVTPKVEEKKEVEELEYTTIEPDQKTAQLELKRLEEELKRQQEIEELEEEKVEDNNISLTNYEEEQEENAIISLEELVKKSKDMYEANELTQYADEGNEPITLQELEQRVGKESTKIEDTFIIENVVPEEELVEGVNAEPVLQQITMDDFNTVKVEDKEETKRFKSSPIISPIFGIEKEVSATEMELENTADYDKLDQEIKKTNEFLMTLRELQSKLD